jgi:hypothetical protein
MGCGLRSPQAAHPTHRVIPAQAGTSVSMEPDEATEVPAFAGMTLWIEVSL